MALRLKLLRGATALLYIGPLLAGLAGFGPVMLLPFVSVFVLWQMLLRPHLWPQSNAEWLTPQAWVTALTQVLTQLLLVATLFAIGRGIGGVTGNLPLFFPLLPIAVSFTAVPLGRLVWQGEQALQQGVTLDDLLAPQPQPDPAIPLPTAATPEEAVHPLFQLPEDAPLTDIAPVLDEALEDAGAWAVVAHLTGLLDAAPGRYAGLRHALILWATDPEPVAANAAPAALRAAFRLAGRDPALLAVLLPRAAHLARTMPQRHPQFPEPAELAALLPLPAALARHHAALTAALAPRPQPRHPDPQAPLSPAPAG
ncbi:MAG: hypothetical protein R3D63_15490 [Paracoccaceae bacterium]